MIIGFWQTRFENGEWSGNHIAREMFGVVRSYYTWSIMDLKDIVEAMKKTSPVLCGYRLSMPLSRSGFSRVIDTRKLIRKS
jgi:hypothetical protein